MTPRIVAVVPALDEAGSIGAVVTGVLPFVDRVIVVDNGSRDRTAEVARAAGARVVTESRRGYGAACLRGIAAARDDAANVILFLDGDGSDDPADAPRMLREVLDGDVDLVLGVRRPESIAPGAMTPVQRFGNWLAPRLMFLASGARYSDMPPQKAIRASALDLLDLRDTGHGFTIELLLKAHARRLRVREVVVRCRARMAGVSKVSGSLIGASRATVKIVASIARAAIGTRIPARFRG